MLAAGVNGHDAGWIRTCSFRQAAQCDHINPTIVPDRERSCVFQQSGPDDWGSFPGSSVPVSPALALVGFIGLSLLVGAVDGSMTVRAVHSWYAKLHAPPGTPPTMVFAPVWTMLYVMIGTAAWLV